MQTIRSEARHGSVSAAYGRLPATFLQDERLLTADWSIDVSFRGHASAVIRRPGGRAYEKPIIAGTCTIYAGGPAEFLELTEPSEYVELVISPELRQAAAEEFRADGDARLADIDGIADPVVWAAGSRVRAAALGGEALDAVELDTLAYRAFSSLVLRAFGGTRPRSNSLGLDRSRMDRLVDYIEARLGFPLGLDDLAGVACLSRWHFLRSFKATFGVTPHHYVRSRRMERVRSLLLAKTTVTSAAQAVGMSDNHSFRAAFVKEFGMLPVAVCRDWDCFA